MKTPGAETLAALGELLGTRTTSAVTLGERLRLDALPESRSRVGEDEVPRTLSEGIAGPLHIIEGWGHEVILRDSTGAEIERWVEWERYMIEDANGITFELHMNLPTHSTRPRIEHITTA